MEYLRVLAIFPCGPAAGRDLRGVPGNDAFAERGTQGIVEGGTPPVCAGLTCAGLDRERQDGTIPRRASFPGACTTGWV